MAVRIRLTRVGATKQPTYRVVVADSRSARDSRSIETIGHYNPRKDPVDFQVDAEKAKAWIAKGATPSETVARLFRNAGVLPASSGKQYPKAPAKLEKATGKKAASVVKSEAAETPAAAPASEAAEQAVAADTAAAIEPAGTTETIETTEQEASK